MGLWLLNKLVWLSDDRAHADHFTVLSLGLSSRLHAVWGEPGQQRLVRPAEEVNWISAYLISCLRLHHQRLIALDM